MNDQHVRQQLVNALSVRQHLCSTMMQLRISPPNITTPTRQMFRIHSGIC